MIPTALRHEVLLQAHDSPFAAHFGVHKTYAKLRDKYFWPRMFADVQHYVLSCESCAMKKSPKQRRTAPVLPIPVSGPWELVATDCCGPFPESNSGNRYVVVFTDYCTRWVEAFAVPNIEAKTIARLLVDDIMGRHGAPRKLHLDRGSNYLSSLIREVCFLMNTEKVFTSSYHPQCDGLVERFNGTMAQCISHYVDRNQKNWDTYLNAILFAFRTSPNDAIGESPFFMMYGRDPVFPQDCSLSPPREMSASVAEHRERVVEHIEIARRISAQNIQRAQQRMKDLHDRYAEPTQFQLGDRVWVFCPKNPKGVSKKLAHNYHGPYRMVESLSPVHCILRATDNRHVSTTVHVPKLTRYIDPADRPSREPLFQVDEPFLADSDLPTDSFISEDLNLDLSGHQALPDSDDVDTAPSPATNVPPVSAASPVRPPSSLAPTLSGFSSTPTPVASEPAVSLASASRLLADSDGAPTDLAVDCSTVYQAERIMRHRIRNGKPQFLLKWSGFPHDQNTWEPREHLLDDRLLKDYLKRNPGAKRVLDPDPHYNPPVAAMSSSPCTEASSVVAFLTLEIDSTCCDKHLSLCLLNARSVKNKTADLFDYICDCKADLVAITETWLTTDDAAVRAELCPVEYKISDRPRTGRRGGGVALIYL